MGGGESETTDAAIDANEKLSKRVEQLLKGGCGAEIIAESSTVTRHGNRSKVCINQLSGLSAFFPVSGADPDKYNNSTDSLIQQEQDKIKEEMLSSILQSQDMPANYDALIPSSQLQLLQQMATKVGVVSAVPGAKLGVDAQSFEVTMPRGRWTHISIVATDKPQDRVTLYMDGKLAKSLKDCAFPLPMSAHGGAANSLSSFEGALMDIRLWRKPRSTLEIELAMHTLINLTDIAFGREVLKKKEKEETAEEVRRRKALSDDGLLGWYTMEDGPDFKTTTDLTAHRFDTRIMPNQRTLHSILVNRYNIPDEVQSKFPISILKPPIVGIGGTGGIGGEELTLEEPQHEGFPVSVLTGDQDHPPLKAMLPTEEEKGASGSRGRPATAIATGPSDTLMMTAVKPSKWLDGESLEFTERVMPIPSYRERNLCVFELKRNRLAKQGRELQREVVCPLDCKEPIRAMDLRFHVRFECQQRIVMCRFDWCHASFPLRERTNHENTVCKQVLNRENILELSKTDKLKCGLCSKTVRAGDMEDHDNLHCLYRMVNCPNVNDGCTATGIQFHELEHHLQFDCDSNENQNRDILIERARQRSNYPRPWGIRVNMEDLRAELRAMKAEAAKEKAMEDERKEKEKEDERKKKEKEKDKGKGTRNGKEREDEGTEKGKEDERKGKGKEDERKGKEDEGKGMGKGKAKGKGKRKDDEFDDSDVSDDD